MRTQKQKTLKAFNIKTELPPEYRESFEKFAKANDRDMKKQAAHVLKNAVDQWLIQIAQSANQPTAN